MTLVVGVDGGGTHTRAVVVDREGNELARAEAGPAVVGSSAPGLAVRAVAKAAREAVTAAGGTLPVGALWAGLAGAGAREVRLAVTKELVAADLARSVVVGTDVEAAFHDMFAEGPGVLLIAGTGSIAWARGPDGRTIRVGGWGERLGDEGSGYAIGLAALRAVARATDGRGPSTSLVDAVMERVGAETPRKLIPWAAGAAKGDVAALVPLVSVAASAGDAVAAEILERAVSDLSAHLAAAVERAGPWPEPPELALWGGLLGEGGPLREAVVREAGSYPVRLSDRPVDPAMGAAKLALAGPHRPPDAD